MITAQSRARTALTHLFRDEYRKYYLEEKKKCRENPNDTLVSHIRAQAQNRAKTLLVQAHPEEYRKFYNEAKAAGLPSNYIYTLPKEVRGRVVDQ